MLWVVNKLSSASSVEASDNYPPTGKTNVLPKFQARWIIVHDENVALLDAFRRAPETIGRIIIIQRHEADGVIHAFKLFSDSPRHNEGANDRSYWPAKNLIQ
jgi:hypothetical protein